MEPETARAMCSELVKAIDGVDEASMSLDGLSTILRSAIEGEPDWHRRNAMKLVLNTLAKSLRDLDGSRQAIAATRELIPTSFEDDAFSGAGTIKKKRTEQAHSTDAPGDPA